MKKILYSAIFVFIISTNVQARNYFTVEITSPDEQRKNTIVISEVKLLVDDKEEIEKQYSHLPFTKTYFADRITAKYRNGMEVTNLNKVLYKNSEIIIKIYRNGKHEQTFKNEGIGNQITIIKFQGSNNPYEHYYETKKERESSSKFDIDTVKKNSK